MLSSISLRTFRSVTLALVASIALSVPAQAGTFLKPDTAPTLDADAGCPVATIASVRPSTEGLRRNAYYRLFGATQPKAAAFSEAEGCTVALEPGFAELTPPLAPLRTLTPPGSR